MKKMNGLFVKIAAALMVCTMLLSMVPVMAAEEQQTYWKTIETLSFDGFTDNTAAPQSDYFATGTVDGRTVYADSSCENYSFAVGSESGLTDGISFVNDTGLYAGANVNTPEVLVGNGYRIWNAWNSGKGKWSTPLQSAMFYNIFDTNDVKVGDVIKITTWIYSSYSYKWEKTGSGASSFTGEPTRLSDDTPNSIRMFVSQKANTDRGFASDYNAYNPNFTSEQPDEYVKATLTNGQWNEVSITYDITSLNKDIASIRFDQVDCYDSYAGVAVIAGFKVEKMLVDEEITDGSYTTILGEVDMDGFTTSQDSSYTETYTKTVGDRTYKAELVYGGFANEKLGPYTNIANVSGDVANVTGTVPAIFTNSKAAHINRNYQTSPAANITVRNMFDLNDVKVGDRVKITAYICGLLPVTGFGGEYAGVPTATELPVRMWLSQPDDAELGLTAYKASAPDTGRPNEMYSGMFNKDEWTEISFEYVVDEQNKVANSIRMDNVSETSDVYPADFYLAGVKAEKIVNAAGTYSVSGSNVTGSLDVGVAVDLAGIDAQIIVAAYNGEIFLDCDFIDYEEARTYNFEMTDALGTNRVRAFIWDMDRFAAKIYPIELTLAQ